MSKPRPHRRGHRLQERRRWVLPVTIDDFGNAGAHHHGERQRANELDDLVILIANVQGERSPAVLLQRLPLLLVARATSGHHAGGVHPGGHPGVHRPKDLQGYPVHRRLDPHVRRSRPPVPVGIARGNALLPLRASEEQLRRRLGWVVRIKARAGGEALARGGVWPTIGVGPCKVNCKGDCPHHRRHLKAGHRKVGGRAVERDHQVPEQALRAVAECLNPEHASERLLKDHRGGATHNLAFEGVVGDLGRIVSRPAQATGD